MLSLLYFHDSNKNSVFAVENVLILLVKGIQEKQTFPYEMCLVPEVILLHNRQNTFIMNVECLLANLNISTHNMVANLGFLRFL